MSNKNMVVDSSASRHIARHEYTCCKGYQPWIESRQSHLMGHCYHIGNAERYESDSNESSKYSLPTLIPRVDSSDEDSDKESDWTSTTEELTDNKYVISHESEAPNENSIKVENLRVIKSKKSA